MQLVIGELGMGGGLRIGKEIVEMLIVLQERAARRVISPG